MSDGIEIDQMTDEDIENLMEMYANNPNRETTRVYKDLFEMLYLLEVVDGLTEPNITAEQCRKYAEHMKELDEEVTTIHLKDFKKVDWELIAKGLNRIVERYLKEREE